jgi:hypothetical protein
MTFYTAASAKMLLDSGDTDGACNRAYYAMFDAARAALLASKAPVTPEIAKTHSGLLCGQPRVAMVSLIALESASKAGAARESQCW